MPITTTEKPLPKNQKKDTILPKWLLNLCTSKKILWIALIAGVTLSLPSLFTGYIADDHLLVQNVNDNSPYIQRSVTNYFTMITSDSDAAFYRDKGIVSWWTPDQFRIKFFRPLSSLVHATHLKLFPQSPFIMHLSLILLYGVLILITSLLLKRFSSSTLIYGLGLILFAINDTHAYTTGWISGLNTMLSCIFGYAAILFFDKWYRDRWKAGYTVAILLFILSLLSSEGGLALIGYLLAYTLFICSGKISSRIKAVTPFILLAIAYLTFYSVHHYGVIGSDVYIEASASPLFTLYTIVNNSIVLTISQLVSFPPLGIALGSSIWGGIVALIMLGVLGLVFRKFFIQNRMASFYGTALILSIMPFTLSGTQDRVLLWAGLAAAGLLSELCAYLITIVKEHRTRVVTGKVILFNNLVFSLLFFIPLLFMFMIIESSAGSIEKSVSTRNTIVFNAPMDIFFMYPAALRAEKNEKWPDHVHSLYNGSDTLIVTRTGESIIEAKVASGWLKTDMERFSRAKRFTFKQGVRINLSLMDIAVTQVTPDGRPETVQFTFKGNMDDIDWMEWKSGGPVPCKLPEIGQQISLVTKMF